MTTAEEVRSEIVRHVVATTRGRVPAERLADDTNLVAQGFLDSIGFVGLIAALEEKFGVELDLVEKPIEEFIVLGSLVKQVLGN